MQNRIKILFLAANPTNVKYRLRLDEEVREIGKKLKVGSLRDSFELVSEWCVRTTDLQEALQTHNPHIVHFSGHGTMTEGVVLEDDQGGSKTVNKEALVDLFRILKGRISIVVLNACHSQDQATRLQEVIDFTIGMNNAIGDKAAIIFAAHFYQSLAFGRSVREAFDLGINQLRLNCEEGSNVPQMLVRPGIDASKARLAVAEPATPGEARGEGAGRSQQDLNLGEISSKIVDFTNVDGIGDSASVDAVQHVDVQRVTSDQFTLTNVKNRRG